MASMTLVAFGLRGASAAAKFLLVMYIAAGSDTALLGQVAIMTTLTAFFTQVAGLEINQVVGRQLHKLERQELTGMLRGQTAACLVAYAALVPVAFVFYPDLLNPYWFCVGPILILEHFVTEVYRLNILLLRPVFASCLLFVKNAGWVILFVALTASGLARQSFPLLLYCWSGVLLLTSLPLLAMAWRQHRRVAGGKVSAIHRAPGLVKEAMPFIASAVLTAAGGAIDKLMISKAFPVSELGVYFFFSTCASILTLVVTFSVGSTAGPACIKAHATDSHDAFMARLRKLKRQYWATILATSALIAASAVPLLVLIDKQAYAGQYAILLLLVASAAFLSLCDPYKLDEYLSKRDGSLLIGNVFHVVSLIIAIAIGARAAEIAMVATGVMLSSLLTYLFFLMRGPRRLARLMRLHH
jgi:O-antigen/teichoic acid export membrane protein